MTGQPLSIKRNTPHKAAATRNTVPIPITCRKDISPVPVRRRGPIRFSPSAPFRPSTASLKKFVAIWMHSAPRSVHDHSHQSMAPCSFHANTPPAHTGTIPAARVLGLDPETTALPRFVEVIAAPSETADAGLGECKTAAGGAFPKSPA